MLFFVASVVAIICLWGLWASFPLWLDSFVTEINMAEIGQWGDAFGALNALFSAAAFVGLLVTLRRQAREIVDQQHQIAEQNKRFDAAEATTKKQLRAYVLADQTQLFCDAGGQLTQFVQPGAHAIGIVRFSNSGQTPAKNVRVAAVIALRSIPTNPEDFPPPAFPHVSATTLGPQVSTTSDAVSPGVLDVATFEDILADSIAVFLYGVITYEDVFGDVHTTSFRLRNKAGVTDGAMTFSVEGNDFD